MTPTQLKAIHRLGAKLPFLIEEGNYKDDRRNRIYFREVVVRLAIETDESGQRAPCFIVRDRADGHVRKALSARGLRVHPDPDFATKVPRSHRKTKLVSRLTQMRTESYAPARMSSEAGVICWSWTLRFSAERPSETIPFDRLREWVQENVCPAIAEGLRLAYEQAEAEVRMKAATGQADHIARWAATYAIKQAKKATRYDQRIAALVAEMNAEIEAQCALMREERSVEKAAKAQDHDGTLDPIALQFAVTHFHQYTKNWNNGLLVDQSFTVRDLFPNAEVTLSEHMQLLDDARKCVADAKRRDEDA